MMPVARFKTRKDIEAMRKNSNENVFHGSAETNKAGMYHPQTPLQVVTKKVGKIASDTVKNVGSVVKKGVDIMMGPTVKVMKKRDEEMKEMSRKAKSGEFNR
jgi:hypothetical protein